MGEGRMRRGLTACVAMALVLGGVLAANPAGSTPEPSGGSAPPDGAAGAAEGENSGAVVGDISVPNVNNASQSSVNDSWFDVMVPALAEPSGWTGSVAGCNAGTTSDAAYTATLRTVNWVREMAGVNQVTELAGMRGQLQETALIMKANGALSHNPPNSWTCWTQAGRDGSAANLSRGAGFGSGHFDEGYGANAVMSQMRDGGESNFMVGHRRFTLDPRATQVAAGFTDDTAAIWPEYDDPFGRPDAPLFVPWPSAGHFPAVAEPEGRWSLSAHREADFSAATVSVTPQGGSTFSITPNTDFEFIADDTVVFDFVSPNAIPAPFPNGDPRTYTITVSNIGDENSGFYPQIVVPTSYTYSVTLFNAVDSTPATAPGAPTSLVATPGNGQVGLTWSPPSSNGGSPITGYRVYRNGTLIPGTLGAGTTSFTDMGRTNGTSYSYQVAAVNTIGEGTKSGSAAATPRTTPGAPTLTATPGNGEVGLSWTVPGNGGSAITGYRVYRDNAQVGGTLAASTTSFTDTGRTNGTSYSYQVAAVNAAGEGPRSAAKAATPSASPPPPAFTDVPPGHQFADDIAWMAAEGISTGFQPGPTYRPAAAVSRQAMSAFMYRLAGSPAFTPSAPTFGDVSPTNDFFLEIEWMASMGITTGTPTSGKPLYKPSSPVSRGAMAAFMYRLAGEPAFVAPPANDTTFGDVGATYAFYAEVEWMASEEISEGTAASPKPLYKPTAAVSRGAMSAFMHRLADGPGVGV